MDQKTRKLVSKRAADRKLRFRKKLTGIVSSGLTANVAEEAERAVKLHIGSTGQPLKIKSMHFLPSTKVDYGSGFQLVANTIAVGAGTQHVVERPRVFETVVTVGRGKRGGQSLESVKIPSLSAE